MDSSSTPETDEIMRGVLNPTDWLKTKVGNLELQRDYLTNQLENARAAFGEHPDSEFDLAERISQLRDEHRNDFHVHTRNLELKEEVETANKRIGLLLCRIYRDGGHYQAAHGTRKACEDADLIMAKLNVDCDELNERLQERCRDYTTHAAKELDKQRVLRTALERISDGHDWMHPTAMKKIADQALKTQ